MNALRIRSSLAAVLIGVASFAAPGRAQSAASFTVLSGNGQVICSDCGPNAPFRFEPLKIQLLDANGSPVPGAAVQWTVDGQVPAALVNLTTTTDASGQTTNAFSPGQNGATFAQWVVTATSGDASIQLIETRSSSLPGEQAQAAIVSPAVGFTYTGAVVSDTSPPIHVKVYDSAGAIPGVSVRLIDLEGQDPAMTCATGENADPGSVLTDISGEAVCYPRFGVQAGTRAVQVLVGGVAASLATGLPVGYFAPGYFFAKVSPAVASAFAKISADPQKANPGDTVTLQGRVQDLSGLVGVAGVTVSWTVTQGQATLEEIANLTDASGMVGNKARLPASAAGLIKITAKVTGTSISTVFTIDASAAISALSPVSGDGQSAPVTEHFPQQVAVLVKGAAGQPLANVTIDFAVSGPATISAATVNSDASGVAQVNVTAGPTSGAVTITASAGSTTQSFHLTVISAGPLITSFSNGAQAPAGSNAGAAMSPCSIATLTGTNLAPAPLQGSTVAGMFGPLPAALAGVHISFNAIPAPIMAVTREGAVEEVTFQVPCEVSPGDSVPVNVTSLAGSRNTTAAVLAVSPGIFESANASTDGMSRAKLIKQDGSYVTDANPARPGDIVRVYATGLGPTMPPVSGSNALPSPAGLDSTVRYQVAVTVGTGAARVVSAKLSPDLIGVYVVDFEVPKNAPTDGDAALVLSVTPVGAASALSSPASKIYIR